jgi:hypothetical protein
MPARWGYIFEPVVLPDHPSVTGRPSPSCCKDAHMRNDPDPGGSELQLLGQYLDNQRETVLLKADGLSGEQLVQKLLPQISLLAACYTTWHWSRSLGWRCGFSDVPNEIHG